MSDRTILAQRFLDKNGWANTDRTHLAGDASNRSYQRLRNNAGETVVLMDAPPAQGEDVQPFIAITNHLRDLNFSAPRILAQDTSHGFLLIEDLGDALFAKLISGDPEIELPLYAAAVDVLLELHQHPPPDGLLEYSPVVMAEYIAPVFDWYHTPTTAKATEIILELKAVLTAIYTASPVMSLRDYHAENLLWLPQRAGTKRVGLLDYQDAVKTHPAYDLASLLQDARRDVSDNTQNAMINRYISATNTDLAEFLAAYNALGAQRNLRILGIFARLSAVAGKPDYINLIPRVWSHLERDLSHPALEKLSHLVLGCLPKPSAEHLQRLKSKCTNPQMP